MSHPASINASGMAGLAAGVDRNRTYHELEVIRVSRGVEARDLCRDAGVRLSVWRDGVRNGRTPDDDTHLKLSVALAAAGTVRAKP